MEDNDLLKEIELLRNAENRDSLNIDIAGDYVRGFKGYASIVFDLKIVTRYLDLLTELKSEEVTKEDTYIEINQIIERSLFVSSIITYARCFTRPAGRGIKLDAKSCLKNQPALFLLHEQLMEIRNLYLAHAGVTNSENIFATANFTILGKDVDVRLGYEIVGQYGLSLFELKNFLILTKYIEAYATAKRSEAADAYLKALSTTEKNELLKKAILKNKPDKC